MGRESGKGKGMEEEGKMKGRQGKMKGRQGEKGKREGKWEVKEKIIGREGEGKREDRCDKKWFLV